ncbi:hypothetical protein H8487_002908 [Listeria monocytogenes]|nr:hypothetical protein [Listeria monocytogenes]
MANLVELIELNARLEEVTDNIQTLGLVKRYLFTQIQRFNDINSQSPLNELTSIIESLCGIYRTTGLMDIELQQTRDIILGKIIIAKNS